MFDLGEVKNVYPCRAVCLAFGDIFKTQIQFRMLGIIPSRYASTRFPGKALADIGGKSMIRRVYEQASKAEELTEVLVATDHPLIMEEVEHFGGNVVQTAETHPSGTDRCYEAYQKWGKKHDYVLNIQGDEPFISPQQINLLARTIRENKAEIATLVVASRSNALLFSPKSVQVVLNASGEAMYFSRTPIPCLRNVPPEQWHEQHRFYDHVGIYAFATGVLAKITTLAPSVLEKAEMLEQLRWLEHGFRIRVGITTEENFDIDTPEDLERLKKERGFSV